MKTKLIFLFSVLSLAVFAFSFLPQTVSGDEIDYGPMEEYLPSTAEMSAWVEELWFLGTHGRYGYRMPGTLPDLKGTNYVLEKLKEFGLEAAGVKVVVA